MSDTQDLCPSTDNGNHRYFIFKVVEVFEPYTFKNGDNNPNLYEKVEYALLGCNCSSVIKQKVKQK